MKKLQIVLMGWEYDRIIYGIKQKPPNKVIFISSNPVESPDRNWGQATTNLSEKIANSIKSLIDSEIVFFNYHSVDDCLVKTIELLEKNMHEYDEIDVNISSGTSILKMSMMLAAQYYPLNLFYVIPAQYNHPGEIITTGARGLVDLPSINLDQIALPRKKQAEIIKLIEEKKKSFTNITKEYAKQKQIKLDKEKIKTLKPWVFYYIKKLEEQKLIELTIEKRELFIKLTQTGKFIKLIMKNKKQENTGQTKLKIKKNKGYDVYQ